MRSATVPDVVRQQLDAFRKPPERASSSEQNHRFGFVPLEPLRKNGGTTDQRIRALDAELPDASLDAVFTDPPYFGNVQYGELMDFCYVWLRKLVGSGAEGFGSPSTRSPGELTGNATQARELVHFTEGLSTVYLKMARALKPSAPLAFTYHHNKIEAYHAIGVAILDAGLLCTASIPCPAEMGGSSRPIIAVHKWFARRPGTLFRGLISSRTMKSRRAMKLTACTAGVTAITASCLLPFHADGCGILISSTRSPNGDHAQIL